MHHACVSLWNGHWYWFYLHNCRLLRTIVCEWVSSRLGTVAWKLAAEKWPHMQSSRMTWVWRSHCSGLKEPCLRNTPIITIRSRHNVSYVLMLQIIYVFASMLNPDSPKGEWSSYTVFVSVCYCWLHSNSLAPIQCAFCCCKKWQLISQDTAMVSRTYLS